MLCRIAIGCLPCARRISAIARDARISLRVTEVGERAGFGVEAAQSSAVGPDPEEAIAVLVDRVDPVVPQARRVGRVVHESFEGAGLGAETVQSASLAPLSALEGALRRGMLFFYWEEAMKRTFAWALGLLAAATPALADDDAYLSLSIGR